MVIVWTWWKFLSLRSTQIFTFPKVAKFSHITIWQKTLEFKKIEMIIQRPNIFSHISKWYGGNAIWWWKVFSTHFLLLRYLSSAKHFHSLTRMEMGLLRQRWLIKKLKIFVRIFCNGSNMHLKQNQYLYYLWFGVQTTINQCILFKCLPV